MRHKPRGQAGRKDAKPPGGSGAAGPAYDRRSDLPRLLPLFETELAVPTLEAHARLLAIIRRALRVERNRGIAGDWNYNLVRHAALLRAYRAERKAYQERARRRELSSRSGRPVTRLRPPA